MSSSQNVIRLLFILTSALIGGTFIYESQIPEQSFLSGALVGVLFSISIIMIEVRLKKLNIQIFNLLALGLFFGYLMGTVLLGLLDFSAESIPYLKAVIYLTSVYFGISLTMQAAQQLHLVIPFVRFHANTEKKRDILLDDSSLLDTRVIDLASTGLMDNQLLVPRFVIKKFHEQLESGDDTLQNHARRGLDVIKKLEQLPFLGLRYVETDFPEIKEDSEKFVRLAKISNANLLAADIGRVQQSSIESIEGVRVINLNALSNALKPLTQSGEMLEIKVQRYGKEPGQGVGYLEDGTMVVVNGGADYIGQVIKTHVLSVKHTSSGRMIFCNAFEEGDKSERSAARSYFALDRS